MSQEKMDVGSGEVEPIIGTGVSVKVSFRKRFRRS